MKRNRNGQIFGKSVAKSSRMPLNACRSLLIIHVIYFFLNFNSFFSSSFVQFERNTKAPFDFLSMENALLKYTHICCISFIQFGNHVPFTFLIGRALVSAPFISILINKVLLNWIRRCLIETEIMITAKAALCSVFVFSCFVLFVLTKRNKTKKWFP